MITSREKRWLFWFSAGVLLFTTLPYFLAYAHQDVAWRFTGFLFGVEDGNSYIAKMLSGAAGAWLFRSPYTSEVQEGIFAFFPYILLGKLTSPPAQHEQLVALFHMFRILAGFAYIYASYRFLAIFLEDISLRRLGITLITLGGGLGWLLVILGQTNWLGSLPLDFYSPESFGFLEIYGLPHLAAARACLLFGLGNYLTCINRKGVILGGSWILLAAIFQPLTALVGWVVMGVHLAVTGVWQLWLSRRGQISSSWEQWRSFFWRALGMVAISSPLVLYNAAVSSFDPYMRAWTEQNRILSPNPMHYIIAYLLIFPLAIFGIFRIIKLEPWRGTMVAGWVLIFPLLAYIPYNLQRRLPEGVWVAWIVLALIGLACMSAQRKRIVRLAFVLSFPSTLIFVLGGVISSWTPQAPVYRPAEEVTAFTHLAGIVSGNPVVLAAYATSNALPAWAPVRVVAGHGPESIHLAEIQPKVDAFYQGKMTLQEQRDFLNQMSVSYIYWGPVERALGSWNPTSITGLTCVYSIADIQIYRVNH